MGAGADAYKSTHQLCASQRAVENGDGDCRGWSAEVCPTMLLLMVAGEGVRARTMLAEASVGGLVDGCSSWWWERRAELTVVVVAVEERRFARAR